MKIKGYTLHGNYYLADNVIPNKDWEEARKIKEEITLPNGKTVIAHTLSKEELETISEKERALSNYWYWTSTSIEGSGDMLLMNCVWSVDSIGAFDYGNYYIKSCGGGARLGFKNPF